MRKPFLLIVLAIFFRQTAWAQFSTVTRLNPLVISSDTKEKPQSKVWLHDDNFWTVLTNAEGTHVWRLEGTSWVKVLKISPSEFGRADCKVAGNLVHILLFRKTTSYLVSIEYDTEQHTYKLWPERTSRAPVIIDTTAETATIDIDSNQRMWLASDTDSAIIAMWSDPPYANWSKPIVIMNKVFPDDIGAVIALPAAKKIGIFWSNQRIKRFGFKLHADGEAPERWSKDEVPGGRSAINFGAGMADDHLNLSLGKDGTLYCAVKTSYDQSGYPRLGLLVRRPNDTWDNFYEISGVGTRPIVVMNENIGKIRIVFSAAETGGDILYKESFLSHIKFGPTYTLMSGKFNHSTSIKNGNGSQSVIIVTELLKAVGVLVTDEPLKLPDLAASPNPMHSGFSTVIFTVPAKTEYAITLYNMAGKLMRVLEGYAITEEKHVLDIDATQIPIGLYILRLQTDRGSKSLKLLRI